jgi:hypothetical protein
VPVNFIGGGNRSTRENHLPAASHLQTLSHNFVSSTPRLSRIRTHKFSVDRHWLHIGSCKSNFHTIMTTTALCSHWSSDDHNGLMFLLVKWWPQRPYVLIGQVMTTTALYIKWWPQRPYVLIGQVMTTTALCSYWSSDDHNGPMFLLVKWWPQWPYVLIGQVMTTMALCSY